jgi:two-component system cell cycle sensor histidine kinase/response regulator CckA
MKPPSRILASEEAPARATLTQHRHEALCTAIFETNPDAIISINEAGEITEWNPAAEDMFGYTRPLAMGREFAGFIASDPAMEAHRTEVFQCLKTGKGRLIGKRIEMTAMRATGGEFPIELALMRVLDHGLFSFTVCIRDITERKRAEDILRKSEERFRMLVESVEDYAIYLLDPHGRVLTWNAGVEHIEGYRARDIIGRRFNRLYTPEDIALGKPEQALATAGAEGHYSHEGWSVRKDGSRYWASVVLTALRYENGTLLGYSRIGCDHTKLKEAEIEAAKLTVALQSHLRERTAELQAAMQLLQQAQTR